MRQVNFDRLHKIIYSLMKQEIDHLLAIDNRLQQFPAWVTYGNRSGSGNVSRRADKTRIWDGIESDRQMACHSDGFDQSKNTSSTVVNASSNVWQGSNAASKMATSGITADPGGLLLLLLENPNSKSSNFQYRLMYC